MDRESMVAECVEIVRDWPGKTADERARLVERVKSASSAELKRCLKWKTPAPARNLFQPGDYPN